MSHTLDSPIRPLFRRILTRLTGYLIAFHYPLAALAVKKFVFSTGSTRNGICRLSIVDYILVILLAIIYCLFHRHSLPTARTFLTHGTVKR
jgi:hypothetical protein